jgi:hypothetical protein
MPSYTTRWGLSILGPGDALNADGYKALDSDRRLLDRLLTVGCEEHRHTGEQGADRTPTAPPNLELKTEGGTMSAGDRFFYKYTILDDAGNESAPSPQIGIDMPASISAPTAPALTALVGSGSLLPGTYSYVLSAYAGATTFETKAESSAVITIFGINPGSVSIILPDLPLGADGLNVYRKAPSGLHYLYIDSIPNPTNGSTWVDDGSIEGNCDRSLPPTNRTSNANSVVVTFPGATPELPEGWSWRLYRSTDAQDWSHSYLLDLTPVGVEPDIHTPLQWTDTGLGAQTGAPPVLSQVLNSPPKIRLTDAAEVDGYLPPGLVVVPHMVTFSLIGPVTEGIGDFIWVCDYDAARIDTVRAYLSLGTELPDVPLQVDVLLRRSDEDDWTSIFDPDDYAYIEVAKDIGPPKAPATTDLALGDQLCIDVINNGGNDDTSNLSVNVLMYVKSGSTDVTYPWLDTIF